MQPARCQDDVRAAYTPGLDCPLHLAMRELARAAVRQHIYYEAGEYQPRGDLLCALRSWARLHELISAAVCGARGDTTCTAAALDRAVAALPAAWRASVREGVARCLECAPGERCPLAQEPEMLPLDAPVPLMPARAGPHTVAPSR